MTEEEAETKWCPFVRAVTGTIVGAESTHQAEQPTYNRVVNGAAYAFPKGASCMASACMAWRWAREEVSGSDTDGFGYIRTEVTGGYCGLAGAPR